MRKSVLIFILLTTGAAAAQERSDTLAGASVSSTFGSILVPQRIDSGELKTTAGLSEAIRRFSGVQLRDYGGVGGLKTINVRSLGSEHTGIFIDGIQVDNAQNMQVDLGRFGLDGIRSVSLFSGQKVSVLQSAKEYSSANALYLDSGEPVFVGGNDNFRLGLRFGSFGTFSPSMSWEHKFRTGESLRLTAELVSSGGSYRFRVSDFRRFEDGTVEGYDTTMIRRNCDLGSIRVEGLLFSRPESSSQWNLHLYFYDSERGLPGPVFKRVDVYPLSEDRQSDRNASLQARWSRRLSDRWSLMWRTKVSRDFLEYSDFPELRPELDPARFRYTNVNGYVSAAALVRFSDRLRLNMAQDFQYNRLDANLASFAYPERLSSWSAVSGMMSFGGLDASLTLLYQKIHDSSRNGASDRDAVMPSLVMKYNLRDNLTVSGFAKRSYRMPTFNDIYYTTAGAKSLKPEDAVQFDLGVGWTPCNSSGPHFAFKADVYHNRLRNKIIAVPTSNQFRWSMYNLGEVRVLGADFISSFEKTVGRDRLGASGRYTFQQSRDFTSPGSVTYRGQIPYIPIHSGSFNLFNEYRGWRADLTVFAMSERWNTSANLPPYRMSPWVTLDAAASKTFDVGGNDLSVRLTLNNILNRQYEIVDNYPMPGLNALVRVEYSF